MRIRVDHRTVYRYRPAAKSVLQVLRLTPRSHEGQNVVRWRVSAEADVEVQLRRGEDALGNITQTAFVQGPVSELTLSVEGEAVQQEAAHAWAEAYVGDLGWVGFDCANGLSPTPEHVRVAVGLDYLGAAPVRGSRAGGGAEIMDVKLTVSHAALQSQA